MPSPEDEVRKMIIEPTSNRSFKMNVKCISMSLEISYALSETHLGGLSSAPMVEGDSPGYPNKIREIQYHIGSSLSPQKNAQ